MKKKILIAGLLASSALGAVAQDEMKALTLSHGHRDLGSARYQALSGAMGAVGADFSSVSQNPAGIALFRSGGKLSLTGSATLSGEDRIRWYNSGGTGGNDPMLSLSEFSYLTSWGTASQGVTFGLSISNGGRFNDEIANVWADKDSREGTSLADYAAARLNNAGVPHSVWGSGVDPYREAGIPWIGILAEDARWVVPINGSSDAYQSAFAYFNDQGVPESYAPNAMRFDTREAGGVTNMDFALGFRLSPSVNLGLLVRGQTLSYDIKTSYTEQFKPKEGAPTDYLGLDNRLSISGLGVDFGFGVLGQIGSGLRLGASVYTPTFYHLKQDFSAVAVAYNELFRHDTNPNKGDSKEYLAATPNNAAGAFRLSTPWRFGLNAAYIFGRKAIASFDYEFVYTSSARLASDDYGYDADFSADNHALRRHFIGMNRVRLGLEYNVVPRVALRAGYRHETAIAQSKLFGTPGFEELLGGTLVHYRLPRSVNALSAGAGFRLSPSWTLDIAYTGEMSRAVYEVVPRISDSAITGSESFMSGIHGIAVKRLTHTISTTLSVRF